MRLLDAIRDEATKLVRRHQKYAANLEDDVRRAERRSLVRPAKNVLVPHYWSVDPGFDPYHVRKQASSIAYAIGRALERRTYKPRPAVSFEVPKLDGSTRSVSVFQVADNAVSRLVLKQLLAKNSSRLSAHCYAYRTDLSLHDAVMDISSDFRGKKRLFVAEFDFRKFFESISHDHIERTLRDPRFFVTDTELHVIRAFLRAPTLVQSSYKTPDTENNENKRGIPQGTSVSLFLANIAAQPLDRRLERLGVGFARFADDTLIWSDDYSLVCRAAAALEEAAGEMGVDLNLPKSEGISLLVPPGSRAEFKPKMAVEFVGYRVSTTAVGIKSRSVQQIKDRISFLIYSNMLKEPSKGNFVAQRIAPSIDRDYVVTIGQIRRYMYGDLSESQLRRFLARARPRVHYQGLMSFYPIVDDEVLLKKLDGWLLHTLHTSLRRRARLFSSQGLLLPEPHGLSKTDLLAFVGKSSARSDIDLRVPSFARMSKLLREASKIYGANAVANSQTLYGATTPSSRNGYWPVI